jgi:copper homeostasis protein
MALVQPVLEIACFTAEAVALVENTQATRIELSENYAIGGITPSLDTVERALSLTSKPIHLLIRSRGGDFRYTKDECRHMTESIHQFLTLSIPAFVIGAVDERHMPDEYVCRQLLEAAQGRDCYFHRAFDTVPNQEEALELLQWWGFKGILSSGGTGNADQFVSKLRSLHAYCSDRFQLIVGGVVRKNNLPFLLRNLPYAAFHTAALNKDQQLPALDEINEMWNILKKANLAGL